MRKQFLILLFISCCLFSKGQLLSDSFLIDNHYRTFHFKKPSQTNSKASLVFILHGSGGSGEGIMKTAGKLQAIAGEENIVLVYPDGYKHFWNECRKAATSAANIENIDENSFFNRMIEYFISNYQINSDRVFAVGTSGGGHMAYKLAITMPERFTAITAIIANLPDTVNMDCIEKKQPMPVMIINGTGDPTNPYNGGEVIIPGTVLGKVRSTDQTFKYWASLDGYKGKPKKINLPDTDPTDGKTIEKFTYKKKGKPEVVLLKVINGKHDYPNDIDVYLEAWNFFKRQMHFK
ncbi:MAG: poly(3-hydroxybutyrate) depolymerase-like protein [Chitinophagaceae bacterium]|nr:poly(3-hydroxybutyrate) depolymerase-like protein [Chitinophagaceae bacterium]